MADKLGDKSAYGLADRRARITIMIMIKTGKTECDPSSPSLPRDKCDGLGQFVTPL